MFKSQVELEAYLADTCYSEALSKLQEGFKRDNVYADIGGVLLMNRFLLAVTENITLFKKANRGKDYQLLDVELLSPYSAKELAIIALYFSLDCAYKNLTLQKTCSTLGKAVFSEFLMSKIKEGSPEAWHAMLTNPQMKLNEKSETDARNLIKLCNSLGIPVEKWTYNAKIQVGARLLEACVKAGVCDIATNVVEECGVKRRLSVVHLKRESKELLATLKARVLSVGLIRTPFVEPPKPWLSLSKGGFHTADMQRRAPFCIKAKGDMLKNYRENPKVLQPLMQCLNILQNVPFKVNAELLPWLEKFYKEGFRAPEIPYYDAEPEPICPVKYNPEGNSTEEHKLWAQYKRDWREWREREDKRIAQEYRFHRVIQDSKLFMAQERIYFRYTADNRGRVYAESDSLSPQGSDLQKAMTLFYEGCKLDSPEAIKWWKINIANRYGYDKASLEDRVKWVDENKELLIACGNDPFSFDSWREADSPYQFLVCCMEYVKWIKDPENFVSHVPCGLDGACNGLQNYSALLRDAVGGKAVNLFDTGVKQDIYQMVADEAWRLMALDNSPDPKGIRKRWLEHKPNRKIAKRTTMTMPYSCTKHSCFSFILKEYVEAGYVPSFGKFEYRIATDYIHNFIWQALGNVVVKAREGMDWLQEVVKTVMEHESEFRWDAPSGLAVSQVYPSKDRVNCPCFILKRRMLTLWKANYDEPVKRNHVNAIAPNVIHSVDASHMAAVAARANSEGIDSLAMIHDDFGTLANRTEELYHLIREEFVKLHESTDVFQGIYERYKKYDIPPPPDKGDLDIRLVLDSEYFFS